MSVLVAQRSFLYWGDQYDTHDSIFLIADYVAGQAFTFHELTRRDRTIMRTIDFSSLKSPHDPSSVCELM
jgi:hypothetical protein